MKKFLLALFSSTLLFADTEENRPSFWDYHPLHAGGNLIAIGGADVDAPQKGHLYFRKANAYLVMLAPISQESYFFPRVEYNAFTMKWNKNPQFNETHFSYFQFGLTFYTISIEKWRWVLRADYNIDIKHFTQPGPYALFTGLVWGAYQFYQNWHYHIGATGYKGMEGQTVYPIIGFDYSPNANWFFQAIFPIDYTVQYRLGNHWRFSLKGRPLRERFRTGGKEPQPHSVFNYSTIGAEANVQFQIERRLECELYGGYNFGGSFYIKDKSGHNALYTEVSGAPYVGANLDFGF